MDISVAVVIYIGEGIQNLLEIIGLGKLPHRQEDGFV